MNAVQSHLPTEILKEVGKKALFARHHSLKQIFHVVASPIPGIYLQEKLLFHAVESYFIDLYRAKLFHNIEFADQHKRAAFTTNWIARLRPIQLKDGHSVGKKQLMVNEHFALYAGLHHLKTDPQKIPIHLYRNLLYTLHYRTYDPLVLATQMYLIETAFPK